MRVAYVTTYDSSDVEAWSGLGLNIREALRRSGLEIHPIGALSQKADLRSVLRRSYGKYVGRKNFHIERDTSVLRSYAEQVERALTTIKCDVVFSPGTLPIAYLNTTLPIVFWTDSVFSGVVDYYPTFSNLSASTLRSGNLMEQAALDRCRFAIYSSDWAASTAREHYAVASNKIRVVPFGANTEAIRDRDTAAHVIASRDRQVCRLLWLGVDWGRKRGDLAVGVAERLIQRGMRVELHVVGCTPPRDLPDYVTSHGFISKRTDNGVQALKALFRDSHFLLHPSQAECYGLALAEANSLAVPCVAANVGGISSVITDGRNGQLFRVDDGADAYADYIARLFNSRDAYEQLALASFDEYTARLNWTVAATQVRALLEEAVS